MRSAADGSSDFLPDKLFLTPFNRTFQPAKQQKKEKEKNQIALSVSNLEAFHFFAVLRTCMSYSLEGEAG